MDPRIRILNIKRLNLKNYEAKIRRSRTYAHHNKDAQELQEKERQARIEELQRDISQMEQEIYGHRVPEGLSFVHFGPPAKFWENGKSPFRLVNNLLASILGEGKIPKHK
jgi:hypothetical protein